MNRVIVLDWHGTMVKKTILDDAKMLRCQTIECDKNNHKQSLKKYSGIMDEKRLNIELTHLLHVHYLHIANIKGEDIFYPNVLKYVNAWQAKGYALVIVSSIWSATIKQTIELLGISKFFKDVYANSENMIYDKRSMLEMITTELGKPILFVGENSNDVMAGRETNTKTAIITWGARWEPKIYPDYLIQNFKQINDLIISYEESGQM